MIIQTQYYLILQYFRSLCKFYKITEYLCNFVVIFWLNFFLMIFSPEKKFNLIFFVTLEPLKNQILICTQSNIFKNKYNTYRWNRTQMWCKEVLDI